MPDEQLELFGIWECSDGPWIVRLGERPWSLFWRGRLFMRAYHKLVLVQHADTILKATQGLTREEIWSRPCPYFVGGSE